MVDQALAGLGTIGSPNRLVDIGDWIAAIGSDMTVTTKVRLAQQRGLGTVSDS